MSQSMSVTRSARHMARSITGSIDPRTTSVQDTGSGFDSLTEPLLPLDQSVHYDSIYDSSEFANQRNSIEVMRKRLKYHFMSPYQKFRHRGKKPWKLFMQLLKLVVVTVQIFIFGAKLFSVVNYMEDTKQSFNTLFLNNPNLSDLNIYTKEQFYSHIHHAHNQYYNIHKVAFGLYAASRTNGSLITPMQMCIVKYKKGIVDPSNETYTFNRRIHYLCSNLTPFDEHENITSFVQRNHLPTQFTSIISVHLTAKVRSIHLKSPPHNPDCYEFNISIEFDNHNHNGKVPVSLTADSQYLTCNGTVDDERDLQSLKGLILAFDIIVITTCAFSAALCFRSLVKHMRLVWATQRFFKDQLKDDLSYWHCLDLINLWYLLILISDLCTIVGSSLKILIDYTPLLVNYTSSSIFLGVGVLLTWSGLLRFLGYLRKYDVLLVTLRASSPSVLRFCVCASLLYFGYLFCGWIVLGPYHEKFRDLLVVSECLFSLINGDDMFMTFAEMKDDSTALWVFSKIYLYTFISLFIYVVLSLFIGIISDTYERIKDWGHPPCTKLERFVHGNNCQRCAVEYQTEDVVDGGSTTRGSL